MICDKSSLYSEPYFLIKNVNIPVITNVDNPTYLIGVTLACIERQFHAKCSVAKLCLTLCDPMDCSPPGSSVHGIFQARILEWVSISYFNRKIVN